MTTWIVIGAMAFGTYLFRSAALLWIQDADRLPPRIKRWLDYVPPAVLSALVAPDLLPDSGPFLSRKTLVYGVCLVTAVRTRRLIPPLLAAMTTLAVISMLQP